MSALADAGLPDSFGLSTLDGLGRPGRRARGELASRSPTGSCSSAATARSRRISGSTG